MKLRRICTFLYMPEDHSRTREFRVLQLVVFAASLGFCALLLMSGLYLEGLVSKRASQRSVAEVRSENERLTTEISRLERKVALLQADLTTVIVQQGRLTGAAGLQPLGDTVWEAGVGGRSALPALSGMNEAGTATRRLAVLETGLDKLLRQARVQNESCEAMLDTLAARAEARALLPTIRPIASNWINSGFGKRPDPFTGRLTFHEGLDLAAPIGTPVVATGDGVVRSTGFESGFGNIVEIRHGERIVTRYAHLSRSLVQKGERVRRGQVIAYSGKTGRATAPHLHYEIHLGGGPVNPLPFILESYAWR